MRRMNGVINYWLARFSSCKVGRERMGRAADVLLGIRFGGCGSYPLSLKKSRFVDMLLAKCKRFQGNV